MASKSAPFIDKGLGVIEQSAETEFSVSLISSPQKGDEKLRRTS
jgi:hypothetical protein